MSVSSSHQELVRRGCYYCGVSVVSVLGTMAVVLAQVVPSAVAAEVEY